MAPSLTSRASSPASSSPPAATNKTATKKASIPRLLSPNSLVTISVGKGDFKKTFTIHQEFACHYSPVFKAAFNSVFIEGQTQTYHLEDTTESTVRLLSLWMYTQKLELLQDDNKFYKDAKEDKAKMRLKLEEDLDLPRLWVLADKLLIPRLQNLVVDKMEEIRVRRNVVATNVIKLVYDTTSIDSPLRQLLVDQCVDLSGDWIIRNPERFPKAMLLDLVVALSRTVKDRQRRDMANYHVVEELEARYNTT